MFAGGFPPLMLTSNPLSAPSEPLPDPPLLPGPPPAPPLDLGIPFGAPPGTPGWWPSGEMETRAERFPCGSCAMGTGGAGVAERAMNVAAFPFAALACASPTSGAGPASPVCARDPTRGEAPAFSSSLGRAGALGETGNAISPVFCSNVGTSGSGAEVTVAVRCCRGRNLASASLLIRRRGRCGPGNDWSCTIFGSAGRIFGGSGGAAELMSV